MPPYAGSAARVHARQTGVVNEHGVQPDRVHIIRGPRWGQLPKSLDLAEEHLEPPLTEAEVARGWTEDFRRLILASVVEIKSDLQREPYVHHSHYKSWIRAELIDPRVEDERWSYALGPDRAIRDLEMAEDLLAATLSLADDLPDLPTSQSPGGIDAVIIGRMEQSLRWIAATLTRGDFVALGQFEAWDECMRACGVRRRVLTGISYLDQERRSLGANIDFIEGRPPGAVWDRIEAYDSLLVNTGGLDISHRRGEQG